MTSRGRAPAGLLHGETVLVSAAEEKRRFLVDALGFDSCSSYKTDDLDGMLREACQQGSKPLVRVRGRPDPDVNPTMIRPSPCGT